MKPHLYVSCANDLYVLHSGISFLEWKTSFQVILFAPSLRMLFIGCGNYLCPPLYIFFLSSDEHRLRESYLCVGFFCLHHCWVLATESDWWHFVHIQNAPTPEFNAAVKYLWPGYRQTNNPTKTKWLLPGLKLELGLTWKKMCPQSFVCSRV